MAAKSNISLVSKLTYNNEVIEQVSSFKYLGLNFDTTVMTLYQKVIFIKEVLKLTLNLLELWPLFQNLQCHYIYLTIW